MCRYFRFYELARPLRETLNLDGDREVFASIDSDYNPISTIIGPCEVTNFDEIQNLAEYIEQDKHYS